MHRSDDADGECAADHHASRWARRVYRLVLLSQGLAFLTVAALHLNEQAIVAVRNQWGHAVGGFVGYYLAGAALVVAGLYVESDRTRRWATAVAGAWILTRAVSTLTGNGWAGSIGFVFLVAYGVMLCSLTLVFWYSPSTAGEVRSLRRQVDDLVEWMNRRP